METVKYEGKTLTTTDEAYVMQAGNEFGEKELLNAPAVDEFGKEYIIYWDINKKVIIEVKEM